MSWDEVEDILYDGTEKDIRNLVCPICGGNIAYEYTEEVPAFSYSCQKCGHISRGQGGPKPNCAAYFGNKAMVPVKTAKAI